MSVYDTLAAIYDDDMGANIGERDIPLYVSFCRSAQPVLELGCGTGRVMSALLREGIRVSGLDISESMLAKARGNLSSFPARMWNLQRMDISNFEPQDIFGCAICAFSTYSKLLSLEQQRSFFSCIHTALKSGGLLLLDLFIQSDAFEQISDGSRLCDYRNRPLSGGGSISRFKTLWKDVSPQVNKVILTYELHHPDGRNEHFVVEDFTRYSRPEELQSRCAEAGFSIEHRFGDYDFRPFSPDSSRIIITARKEI